MNNKSSLSFFVLSAMLISLSSGCHASTADSAASASLSAQPSASLSTDSATISLSGPTTVEIGYSITIQATVSFAQDEDLTFSLDQPQLASLKSSGFSVKVMGLNPGTVTLMATSPSHPGIKGTLTLTITPAFPVAMHAFYHLIQEKNYTLTSTCTQSGTTKTVAVEKVTPTILTLTDKDGKALIEDSSTQTQALGEGIDKEGFAFEIQRLGNGNLSAGRRLKKEGLFLKADNFLGLGLTSVSPSQYGRFYGLQAINPNWLPSEKNKNNVYSLEGPTPEEIADKADTEDERNAALAETMLWNLLDPLGYAQEKAAATSPTAAYLASLVETTLTVQEGGSLVFTQEVDAQESQPAYTLKGEISAIGSTQIDATVGAYVPTVTAAFPDLVSDLAAAKKAIGTDDYRRSYTLYAFDENAEEHAVSFHIYDTPDYCFTYYDPTFLATWNQTSTTSWDASSDGYVRKADGIYAFTYVDPVYETDGTTLKTAASILLGDKIDGTSAQSTLPKSQGYLSQTAMWNDKTSYVSYLSDETTPLWDQDKTAFHYSQLSSVFDDVYSYYVMEAPDDYAAQFVGVNVFLKEDQSADNVLVTLGYAYDTNGLYRMDFSLDDFQSAETVTDNPIRDLIKPYIGK